MLESTASTGCSARLPSRLDDDALDPAAVVADRDAAMVERTGMPRASTALGERLPHLAGPEPRVEELLDQRRRRGRGAGRGSPSERLRELNSWIRCAAHSAWISEPGMPQTFSV